MPMELVNQLPYDHPYRWDGTLFGKPKLWRPTQLGAELGLWLDAEDTASITLNTGNVAQWNDKSGNNRHASQAAGASQPAYTGKHIQFNGTNFLSCQPGWDDYWEWLAVVKFDRTDVLQVPFRDNVGGNSTAIVGHATSSGGFYRVRNSSAIAYATDIASEFGTNRAIHGFSSRTSNTAFAFVNGTQKTSWAVSGSMGDTLYIGVNGAIGGNGLQGSISEFIVLANEASNTNRQKLEGYLAWKWGLEVNLPVDHPYKTIPPTV